MMYIYSVYDNIAEKYGNPFVAVSDKVAIRDFNVGMASVASLIKKDYALVCIGLFDEEKGEVFKSVRSVLVGSLEPFSDDSSDDSQIDTLKEMLDEQK